MNDLVKCIYIIRLSKKIEKILSVGRYINTSERNKHLSSVFRFLREYKYEQKEKDL